MKALPEIEALYVGVDRWLEQERQGIDRRTAVRVQAQQVLNDQAYFVLCWGQLELEIVDVCRSAIRARRAHTDWQVRRSWYLYNPDDKRLSGLSFEERTALVLNRDEGTGSPWARTMAHYKTRNEIAHGTLGLTRVDVSALIQDCYIVQSALHRAR